MQVLSAVGPKGRLLPGAQITHTVRWIDCRYCERFFRARFRKIAQTDFPFLAGPESRLPCALGTQLIKCTPLPRKYRWVD